MSEIIREERMIGEGLGSLVCELYLTFGKGVLIFKERFF